MADITKSVLTRNAGAAVTSNAGAASQTIVCSRSDENVVIRLTNTDAAEATFRFHAHGQTGSGVDLDVAVAQNGIKAVVLESARFKDPATQKITVEILDADGSSYAGTVTNAKIEVIELPKGIRN